MDFLFFCTGTRHPVHQNTYFHTTNNMTVLDKTEELDYQEILGRQQMVSGDFQIYLNIREEVQTPRERGGDQKVLELPTCSPFVHNLFPSCLNVFFS